MPVCRVLVIEDRKRAADTLCQRLVKLGNELQITVVCTPLVCKNVAAFQTAMQNWFDGAGQAVHPDYEFDITSLDMIFQSAPNMSQADGGAQLFAWLDEKNAVPNLGHVVVRSHQHTASFSHHAGTIVPKETVHEESKWRELLAQHQR